MSFNTIHHNNYIKLSKSARKSAPPVLRDRYLSLLSTNHPPVGQKLCLVPIGIDVSTRLHHYLTEIKFIVYISKIVSTSPTQLKHIDFVV